MKSTNETINTRGKDDYTINGSKKIYSVLLRGLSKGMGEILMLSII